MTESTITIVEACKQFSVTPRTLRFYEQKGLLSPKRKGRHRLYRESDVEQIKSILAWTGRGAMLDEILRLQVIEATEDAAAIHAEKMALMAVLAERTLKRSAVAQSQREAFLKFAAQMTMDDHTAIVAIIDEQILSEHRAQEIERLAAEHGVPISTAEVDLVHLVQPLPTHILAERCAAVLHILAGDGEGGVPMNDLTGFFGPAAPADAATGAPT